MKQKSNNLVGVVIVGAAMLSVFAWFTLAAPPSSRATLTLNGATTNDDTAVSYVDPFNHTTNDVTGVPTTNGAGVVTGLVFDVSKPQCVFSYWWNFGTGLSNRSITYFVTNYIAGQSVQTNRVAPIGSFAGYGNFEYAATSTNTDWDFVPEWNFLLD